MDQADTESAGRGDGGRSDSAGGTSGAVEDYLKAIYKLQRPVSSGRVVSTTALAEELERSAASVTNMVKSLAERGLLEHVPYHGVRLTAEGEQSALRIIRRHRVIELYLIERLGYTWDNVHPEAERLEHAASDELVDRMAGVLGEPAFDPHGSPIPTRDGEISHRRTVPLWELEPGTRAVVREVPDESPDRLRFLATLGLFPGTSVEVLARDPGGDELEVEATGGDEPVTLDRKMARSVRVEEL